MIALKCYADNTDTIVNVGLVVAALIGVAVGVVLGMWASR